MSNRLKEVSRTLYLKTQEEFQTQNNVLFLLKRLKAYSMVCDVYLHTCINMNVWMKNTFITSLCPYCSDQHFNSHLYVKHEPTLESWYKLASTVKAMSDGEIRRVKLLNQINQIRNLIQALLIITYNYQNTNNHEV